MKSNHLTPQSESKHKTHAQISKQVQLNQLSAEKIRSLIVQSIFKKSNSMADLGASSLNNFGTVKTKENDRVALGYHSPAKIEWKGNQDLDFKDKTQANRDSRTIDFEQKRRRVYTVPYFQQECENQAIMQQNQSYFKHSRPPYEHSPQFSKSGIKYYNETISTTSSHKQKKRLKVQDFEFGKILGVGKFGQVFMARHRKSGFVCALKQILKDGLDQTLTSQIVSEIKIQMFLNHPNIVKLYTFFSDDTSIYLVFELCVSGQLYNFLKSNQLVKEQHAKVIIKQICQGLEYIHENHIIHRDLKPENILYHNSMIKIGDFGWSIATPLMRETFCGTPLYVSPELLKRKYYNNKIDTWSLGILAYEILIGQVPFEIFCEADFIKILKNDVRFPKFCLVSDEGKEFIGLCLEKDPQKRLTVRQLLNHSFLLKVEIQYFPQLY